MDSTTDFIMGLFLDDCVINTNHTILFGMQYISNINSECLEVLENRAAKYFPNEQSNPSGFFETVIPTFGEEDYKKTFKMSKEVIEVKHFKQVF